MIKGFVPTVALVAVLASALAVAADAQTPPPFQLGLGDLMTVVVQPRHIKLGLGGQARNWEYATYEWGELNEALELVEAQVPRFGKTAMSDLLQMVREPMGAVQAAIKARDGGQFDAAYARLTDSCNACHQTLDHKMIVIQVPKVSMFPDQNFAP
jgi:hypothetical protein